MLCLPKNVGVEHTVYIGAFVINVITQRQNRCLFKSVGFLRQYV